MSKINKYLSFFDKYLLFCENIVLHLWRELKLKRKKMKRKTSKTQLAFLSILAGFVYLFIITTNVVDDWKSGVMAFKEGWEKADIEQKTGKKMSWETFTLTVEPKNYNEFYSDSLLNIRTGELIPISYNEIKTRYNHLTPQTTKLFWLDVGMMLTALPTVVLYILILILFYKLMLAFYRDTIFSNDNVRRLRLLGIFTLILYGLNLAFYLMYYARINSLIEISHYKLKMPDLSHEILLMGIVLLIATNVMKRAITLKEEQDLTI